MTYGEPETSQGRDRREWAIHLQAVVGPIAPAAGLSNAAAAAPPWFGKSGRGDSSWLTASALHALGSAGMRTGPAPAAPVLFGQHKLADQVRELVGLVAQTSEAADSSTRAEFCCVIWSRRATAGVDVVDVAGLRERGGADVADHAGDVADRLHDLAHGVPAPLTRAVIGLHVLGRGGDQPLISRAASPARMASWRTSPPPRQNPGLLARAGGFHSGVQRQDVGLRQCCRSPRSLSTLRDDCWMFCMVCTTWAIALPPRWPRRCLAGHVLGAGCRFGGLRCCKLPAPAQRRRLQAGCACALGQVGIAPAISWAARRTLWTGALASPGAQGFPAWCSGTAATGPPSSRLCPSMFLRRSRLDTRWAVRWLRRWARNAAHQPPGQHAAQQQGCGANRVSATRARWLFCVTAPVGVNRVALRLRQPPQRPGAGGGGTWPKALSEHLRMRSVRLPKSCRRHQFLTAAFRKSCALSCTVSRGLLCGVCRRVATIHQPAVMGLGAPNRRLTESRPL